MSISRAQARTLRPVGWLLAAGLALAALRALRRGPPRLSSSAIAELPRFDDTEATWRAF